MNAIGQRCSACRIDRFNDSTHARFEVSPREVDLTLKAPYSTQQDPAEPSTLEAILVVHSRLVHHVFECFGITLGTIAEEHHVVTTEDRDRRVFGTHVHDQPVTGGPEIGTEKQIDHSEGADIDE